MTGWIVAACGAFAMAGAALDWDWFMNHRKAQRLVRLFGRGGARGIYAALGAGLLVAGVLMGLGIIEE
jgi:hypothetical protein